MTELTTEQLLPLLQDPRVSRIIHDYSDVDIGANSLHRTLGKGANQALAGNHVFGFDDFAQAGDTPNAPTGINVVSSNQTTLDGIITTEAIITWTPVTGNTDGTSINADDLDCYLVGWRSAGTGDWTPDFEVTPDSAVAYFLGLRPGQHIDVRVAARNLAQNMSAYGYAYDIILSADTTPPNQPSKPVVASLFGAIRVQWDGKDSVGATMALDFDHVDVHVSTSSSFVADDSNKVDSIPTLNGGAVVLSYTDYGTLHYVKFVAVDGTNNHSTQSVASDAVAARQGVNADFQDISATKILAGKLSVDVGLAGRLLIGPLDSSGNLISPLGARIELRNDGMHIFNGSNVEVATLAIISGVPQLNISGPIVSGGTISGATIIGGTIETSTSGKRVVLNGSTNELDFYDSSGTLQGHLSCDTSGRVTIGRPSACSVQFNSDNSVDFYGGPIVIHGTLQRDIGLHNSPVITFNGSSSTVMAMDADRVTGNVDANSQITVGHTLGRTPIAFGATGASGAYGIRNWSKSSSQLTFEVHNPGGVLTPNGTSVTLDWWCVG